MVLELTLAEMARGTIRRFKPMVHETCSPMLAARYDICVALYIDVSKRGTFLVPCLGWYILSVTIRMSSPLSGVSIISQSIEIRPTMVLGYLCA